jgi:phosphatidylserine synthase
MTSPDPQTSIDQIRRLQDRTRDEYVRHGFSRPYLLVLALAIFVMFASHDLSGPWDSVVGLLGAALLVAGLLVHQRRASVRRRPTALEALFSLVVGGVLLLICAVFLGAAHSLDLPAPNTIAATAIALAIVCGAQLTRPVFTAIVRRG